LKGLIAERRGFLFYLLAPVDGRVVLLLGPLVDVPGVLPTPSLLVAPPPAPVPVVPCIPVVGDVEPVAEVPPFVPLELAPEAADPPPLCASAEVPAMASAVVSAIAVIFITRPFMIVSITMTSVRRSYDFNSSSAR